MVKSSQICARLVAALLLMTPQKAELLFAEAARGPCCQSRRLATATAGKAATAAKALLALHR